MAGMISLTAYTAPSAMAIGMPVRHARDPVASTAHRSAVRLEAPMIEDMNGSIPADSVPGRASSVPHSPTMMRCGWSR